MKNLCKKNLKAIYQAAEAIIYLDNDVIIKKRIKKGYRIHEIDNILRRKRTKSESALIRKVSRIGINVPRIFKTRDDEIRMEYLDGKRVKDVLNKKNYKKICKKIGIFISQLHKNNIIHGDLTTSNMILKKDNIYLIDFGLGFHSTRIEDKATDLYLLLKSFESTHFSLAENAWNVILNNYKRDYNSADKVLNRLKKIGERRRYKKKNRHKSP